ncbi:MAG: type IV toxin-antitoxin system AbiEi family antitoxin domain-containing protein [Gammaproteobacteria bacterium]
MNLMEAYSRLRSLRVPAFYTQDVSAYLGVDIKYANKILARLAKLNQVIHLCRGKWIFPDTDPFLLPEILTSPFPAYISLQTALYFHGMISQIPSMIYAVSVARTRVYKTKVADISIHHIKPELFFGFEEKKNGLIKIATPEKALIDFLYLSPGKSRLFAALPEIEIPKSFKISKARKIINQISFVRTQSLVAKQLEQIISSR